ncbi:hypothetical protein [Bradyrhizobium sp.]|uniref:hypothetical protein n=1 Tax=Bradyrhizobium sp. TaxID=376 RepID=UPI00344A5390
MQDGRIHIEKINWPFLSELKGTLAEYRAGLKLAIERGWLWMHESGTYVRFTQAGQILDIGFRPWLAAVEIGLEIAWRQWRSVAHRVLRSFRVDHGFALTGDDGAGAPPLGRYLSLRLGLHTPERLTKRSVRFAGSRSAKSGMYRSTSCRVASSIHSMFSNAAI